MIQLAILLTTYNRKEKTLSCLKNIFSQEDISEIHFTIYLVDDNSSDGTVDAIKAEYPTVNIIQGNGELFWAGGMRLAWRKARRDNKNFDYFLLLNDDTLLFNDSIRSIFNDRKKVNIDAAIIIGSTKDPDTGEFSYGGRLLKNGYSSNAIIIKPDGQSPQLCHLGNANIMLVPVSVVNKIGILSDNYIHGIADYDYTLKAKKKGIPSYISTFYCGFCSDDHGKNWKSSEHSLRQRIRYLYDPKGLSYKEYLLYIRKFFPLYLPQAWLLLWAKTFFPVIWEVRKRK